jgi:peptide/nickel transport system substrate-binding protein
VEPAGLANKPLQQVGVSLHSTKRLFNAELAILDEKGLPQPYLAEAIPQLNTDTWRVFPDGRMETTYRLRPNLTWHDRTPLTAEDFVFARRVYGTPEFGLAASPPINAIEEIVAPDPQTVVIRWDRSYPGADSLVEEDFIPLPRHLLEQPLEQALAAGAGGLESFGAHPYWTREFIAAGPFRLDRWEPGAFIEAVAFDGHVLGRPKIERIRIVFIGDANTALSNLLAGEVHLGMDLAVGFNQAVTLRREWGPRDAGTVLLHPNQWRATKVQFRPDFVNPRALLDVRVRQALAHGVDKQMVNESIYQGEGIIAETMIASTMDYYPLAERTMTKYPYDPRRSEQLMAEAGFSRGSDGVYTSATDGRFSPELKTNASPEFETEMGAMAAIWRQNGFDIQEAVLPAAQAQNAQVRASFSGMYTHSSGLGEAALIEQITARIPGPDNRWQGGNRGGWSNPEYDRLVAAFNTTLDRSERARQIVEMVRISSQEMFAISLFFAAQPMVHVAALRGPQLVAPGAVMGWDIHRWEFR